MSKTSGSKVFYVAIVVLSAIVGIITYRLELRVPSLSFYANNHYLRLGQYNNILWKTSYEDNKGEEMAKDKYLSNEDVLEGNHIHEDLKVNSNTSASSEPKPEHHSESKKIATTATISATIKQKQIQNYINGTGLLLGIHITHHAGTYLCNRMSEKGTVPSFNCMVTDDDSSSIDLPREKVWGDKNKTHSTIRQLRSRFHFVSHEYSFKSRYVLQNAVHWEDEDLVSIIIMRNPLDRFLAGGKCGVYHENGGQPQAINNTASIYLNPEDDKKWWEYANSNCADNYALRILGYNSTCCGEDDLKSAKRQLDRFTFILDQDCLTESVDVMMETLNLTHDSSTTGSRRLSRVRSLFDDGTTTGDDDGSIHHQNYVHDHNNPIPKSSPQQWYRKRSLRWTKHEAARERIVNDTLWEFLNDRFRYDIELYEWSKSRSIIQCKNKK